MHELEAGAAATATAWAAGALGAGGGSGRRRGRGRPLTQRARHGRCADERHGERARRARRRRRRRPAQAKRCAPSSCTLSTTAAVTATAAVAAAAAPCTASTCAKISRARCTRPPSAPSPASRSRRSLRSRAWACASDAVVGRAREPGGARRAALGVRCDGCALGRVEAFEGEHEVGAHAPPVRRRRDLVETVGEGARVDAPGCGGSGSSSPSASGARARRLPWSMALLRAIADGARADQLERQRELGRGSAEQRQHDLGAHVAGVLRLDAGAAQLRVHGAAHALARDRVAHVARQHACGCAQADAARGALQLLHGARFTRYLAHWQSLQRRGGARVRSRTLLAMRLLSVTGTRPQFVKAAPLHAELAQARRARRGRHRPALRPRALAGLQRGARAGRARRAARGRLGLARRADGRDAGRDRARACCDRRPDAMLVYGDTNSTLAGALVAAKLGVPLAHVEAGLRSFDMRMPEEVNRVVTDRLSRLLFCPSETAVAEPRGRGHPQRRRARRRRHGRPRARVRARRRARARPIPRRSALEPGGYALATVHRQANTEQPALGRLVEGLGRVEGPVVLPLHPRTRAALEPSGLLAALERAVHVLPPLGYLDFTALLRAARRLPDRLGRRAEGGVPALGAVRHAARHHASGSRPCSWAGTCSSATIPRRSPRPRPRRRAARRTPRSTATAMRPAGWPVWWRKPPGAPARLRRRGCTHRRHRRRLRRPAPRRRASRRPATPCSASSRTPPRVARINAGDSYIKDVAVGDARASSSSAGLLRATVDYAEVAALRRRDRLRADAADREPRARPLVHHRRDRVDRAAPAARPPDRARVDDLPGHDARVTGPDARARLRPRGGQRLPPRDVARAHRPGPHRLHRAHDAEGRRRPHAPPAPSAPCALYAQGRRHARARSRRPRRPSSRSCSRTSSARSTSRS